RRPDLVPDRRAMDVAALPLRPADAPRLEGSAAARARERAAHGRLRALDRGPGVSVLLFLVLAVLTVGSALVVVLHRHPVSSALGLVGPLGLIAVMFLGLDAQIVGFLQIIVYAGAIVVLFLFVIMLLNLQEEPESFSPPALVAAGMGGGVAFATIVAMAVARAPLATPALRDPHFGATNSLAERLVTSYLLPFELTSILLLVAIVGAVVIGRRKLP